MNPESIYNCLTLHQGATPNIITPGAKAPAEESNFGGVSSATESEVEGIDQDHHSMVNGGQSSGVVAWRKSGIEESDADVASYEDGIACKLWGEEAEVVGEEAEGLEKENLAVEATVSAMKNDTVDGVIAPAAKESGDMSQVDEGDGAGTPLADDEAPYDCRPQFASCGDSVEVCDRDLFAMFLIVSLIFPIHSVQSFLMLCSSQYFANSRTLRLRKPRF